MKITRKFLLGMSVAIFGLWLILGLLPVLIWGVDATAGQFGDMFGAVNSLFSGFALAGVVVAILMQKEELELQRKELVFTRAELEKSAAAQASTANTMLQQAEISRKNTLLAAYTALLQAEMQDLASRRTAPRSSVPTVIGNALDDHLRHAASSTAVLKVQKLKEEIMKLADGE